MIRENDAVNQGIINTAYLMIVSAKTAPKARGVDNIVTVIVNNREDIEKIAIKMEELALIYGDFFKRDADNVRRSTVIVLIGCKIVDFGLKTPSNWSIDSNIVNSIINLGIALGSAVKTASLNNVDNRIMYSVGVAAQELGLINADIVYGIPLSAYGKNIYFDRK